MVRFLSILTLLFALGVTNAYAEANDGCINAGIVNGQIVCLDDTTTNTVPEPGTLALFGLGIVAAGVIARRRRK